MAKKGWLTFEHPPQSCEVGTQVYITHIHTDIYTDPYSALRNLQIKRPVRVEEVVWDESGRGGFGAWEITWQDMEVDLQILISTHLGCIVMNGDWVQEHGEKCGREKTGTCES